MCTLDHSAQKCRWPIFRTQTASSTRVSCFSRILSSDRRRHTLQPKHTFLRLSTSTQKYRGTNLRLQEAHVVETLYMLRSARPNKHEEDKEEMHAPMEVDHVAASQKMKIWKMWTRFEEDRCVRIAGLGQFTSCCRVKGNGRGKVGDGSAKKTMRGTGGIQGRTFGRTGRLGIPGQCWTCGKVRHKSSARRWGGRLRR